MHRCWLLLLTASLAWSASDDWREVLVRARASILNQVRKSTNYTCVQTVDRMSFVNTRDLLEGCAYDSKSPQKKPYMHDRLRLDMAVSEGKEIFAWHGAGRFSGSGDIADVVKRGTISSGEFVGFLQNIFGRPGVRFEYTGKTELNGATNYLFAYTVPVSSSGYRVRSKQKDSIVPYHGSFSVRESDSQLASLSAIADAIPENSQVCSTETEMNYQMVKISGEDALIPSLVILKMADTTHLYTVSRNQYSQCHAFKAQSTVRFDVDDGAAAAAVAPSASDERLPARTVLHIALQTPIDEETTYTGDAVEGTLLHPLKTSGTTVLPKGTLVTGVITMLEERSEPFHHFLMSIEFARLTSGGKIFLLRATPLMSKAQAGKLVDIYGGALPEGIRDRFKEGIFVFESRHLHLDQRFAADWITQQTDNAVSAAAATSAR